MSDSVPLFNFSSVCAIRFFFLFLILYFLISNANFNLFISAFNSSISVSFSFTFVKNNWSVLYERYGNGGFAFSDLVGGTTADFYTQQKRDDVFNFYSRNKNDFKAAEREIKKTFEKVDGVYLLFIYFFCIFNEFVFNEFIFFFCQLAGTIKYIKNNNYNVCKWLQQHYSSS